MTAQVILPLLPPAAWVPGSIQAEESGGAAALPSKIIRFQAPHLHVDTLLARRQVSWDNRVSFCPWHGEFRQAGHGWRPSFS